MSEQQQQHQQEQTPVSVFASAVGEWDQPFECSVTTGEVPGWLDGSLIRNGPGQFEVGDSQYRHLFDGLALLQQFSIRGGCVSYSSRFVGSDARAANLANRRIVVAEFGTAAFDDPCKSLLGKFAAYFSESAEEKKLRSLVTDNTVVNVFAVGDQIFAATETPMMNRIHPRSLQRLQLVDFGKLVSVNTVTAHPHFDADGSAYNLGSALDDPSGPKYLIVRMAKGQLDSAEVVARIPARWRWHPAYYHSFGVTENFFVFVESPLTVSILRILAASKTGGSFSSALKWYDGEDSLFHVYRRSDGGHVKTVRADAFFTFHHMNAYEEEGGEAVVVDLCAYESGEVVFDLELEKLRSRWQLPRRGLQLRRYRLLLNSAGPAAFEVPADDVAMEFPQINYRLNGRPYRYGYGVGCFRSEENCDVLSRVLKVDWRTGRVLTWQEENCQPSESVFVQRPGAADEDDGVLLSSVIRLGDSGRSLFLLILDAASMQEVARVAVDGVSVPMGFHGSFFDEELLQRAALSTGCG